MMRLGLILTLLLTSPAAAQTDPTITAGRASAMLEAAADALALADGARDRVAALTQTIGAFEEGLAATREALRRSSAREAVLTRQLAAERERLAGLLAAAQAIERAPAPLLMLHPSGPLGAARSGMIISDVAPAMAAETARIRAELEELNAMRAIQTQARADLTVALAGLQQSRAALSEAIADRVDLPPRVDTDPAIMTQVLNAATSLDGLTEALRANPPGPLPEAQRMAGAQGALPLPAFGAPLRGFGEADAAGLARPGLILAVRPEALVTAPWGGTVRYAGALPDLGSVVLLETDPDHMIILGGIGTIFVTTGEIVTQGAPLGLAQGSPISSEELITQDLEGTGLTLSETLYIELRVNNEPVDPELWFRLARDED